MPKVRVSWLVQFLLINFANAQQANTSSCAYYSADTCDYYHLNSTFSCPFSGCSAIPDDIPDDAINVNLRGNLIETVTTTLRDFKNLEYLDLSRNRISSIAEYAFAESLLGLNLSFNVLTLEAISKKVFHLGDLECLNLASNKIENLTIPDIFSPWLPRIKYLDLSGNRINSIDRYVISDMTRLEFLDLSRNWIRDVNQFTFLGLSRLALLNLSKNSLEAISDNPFHGLRQLKEVDLSDNLIGEISNDGFAKADSLEILHLERNRIHVFPAAGCQHLKSLVSLYLDENPLETIEPFCSTVENISITGCHTLKEIGEVYQEEETKLSTVVISGNKGLAKIAEFAFGKIPPALRRLDLSKNALTTLPATLVNWDNLTSVNLAGNFWDCDCNMAWVKDLPPSSKVLDTLVCYNPLHLRGSKVSSLDNAQFSCGYVTRYRGQAAIVFAIIFTAIVIGSLAFVLRRCRHKIFSSCHAGGKYETLYSSAEAAADDDACHAVTIKKSTISDEPVAV